MSGLGIISRNLFRSRFIVLLTWVGCMGLFAGCMATSGLNKTGIETTFIEEVIKAFQAWH